MVSTDAEVDKLINLMEHGIGKNININNMNIYLKKTTYIVDHDHIGNMRKEPLIFFDDENKMEFKKDDKYFETDIYYYVDKSRNITIYYDANELEATGVKIAAIQNTGPKTYSELYKYLNDRKLLPDVPVKPDEAIPMLT